MPRARLLASLLLSMSVLVPAVACAQLDSPDARAFTAVPAYLAQLRRGTLLRVAVDTARYEGMLDTSVVDRFTLARWSGGGLNFRELVPVAKIPFARVDTIWTRRAGVPGGIARGIAWGGLAGIVAGLTTGDRLCPVENCSSLGSATWSSVQGAVVGGIVGGVVGMTRRGWKLGYPKGG